MRLFSLLFLASSLFPHSTPPEESKPIQGDQVAVIFMEGEVTEDSVNGTLIQMAEARKDGAKSILMEIDSPGGSVMAGMKLAKVIELFGLSGTPVVCLVDTSAFSMAYYILQSCTVRVMTDRSLLMAHEPSFGSAGGNSTEMEKNAELLTKLSHAMSHHEARRLKMTVEQFEAKIHGKDWFMTDEEALEVGAVDYVVSSIKEVEEAMERAAIATSVPPAL